MCGMVIWLECLDFLADSIAVETDVKGLSRLYILHNIYKVTCVLQFSFVDKSGLAIIQFHLRLKFMIYTCSFDMTSSNIPTFDIF